MLVSDLPEMREAVPDGGGVFADRTPDAFAAGVAQVLGLRATGPTGPVRAWYAAAHDVLASVSQALHGRRADGSVAVP